MIQPRTPWNGRQEYIHSHEEVGKNFRNYSTENYIGKQSFEKLG